MPSRIVPLWYSLLLIPHTLSMHNVIILYCKRERWDCYMEIGSITNSHTQEHPSGATCLHPVVCLGTLLNARSVLSFIAFRQCKAWFPWKCPLKSMISPLFITVFIRLYRCSIAVCRKQTDKSNTESCTDVTLFIYTEPFLIFSPCRLYSTCRYRLHR